MANEAVGQEQGRSFLAGRSAPECPNFSRRLCHRRMRFRKRQRAHPQLPHEGMEPNPRFPVPGSEQMDNCVGCGSCGRQRVAQVNVGASFSPGMGIGFDPLPFIRPGGCKRLAMSP